jgi:hypothetical protein
MIGMLPMISMTANKTILAVAISLKLMRLKKSIAKFLTKLEINIRFNWQ